MALAALGTGQVFRRVPFRRDASGVFFMVRRGDELSGRRPPRGGALLVTSCHGSVLSPRLIPVDADLDQMAARLHCHPLGGTQPEEWGVMSRPSKAETLPKLLVIFRPGGVLLLPRLLIN